MMFSGRFFIVYFMMGWIDMSCIMRLLLVFFILNFSYLFIKLFMMDFFFLRGFFIAYSFFIMGWFSYFIERFLNFFTWLLMLCLNHMIFLFMSNRMISWLGFHCFGQVRLIVIVLCFFFNALLFFSDFFAIFFFKIYPNFIIYERKNHSIVKWNQIWRFMLCVLFSTFHEYKCSVCWHFVFSFFRNEPTFLSRVCNVTVVSRNSF